ncbi:MAG TPA: Ig-like domain-containing protein, partial [Gemmataceae bacterium]|nr:Ig-like domain-containing protein [Gemmataceae bacterium]
MLSAWWQKAAMRRMRAAARAARLRVEGLESRDVPAAIFAIGANEGSAPQVGVFDLATRTQKFTVDAYDASFTGGVRVAVGDVDGDGTGDLITGTGNGGGPIVKVFSGVDGHQIGTFTVGDPGSRSGVSVAAADIDGDGRADIIAGSVQNGQPFVQVLKFSDGSSIRTFSPFQGSPGISVAAGDFNGDGTPDVIVGAGPGDSPRVVVLDGKSSATLFSQFVFEQSFTGGVCVSSGDLNGDGKDEVIAAARFLGGPRVQAFAGGTGAVFQNFFAYSQDLRAGVWACAFDANTDGKFDIVTTNGPGQALELKAFDGRTLATLTAPSFNGMPEVSSDTKSPTPTVSSTGTTTNTSPIPFTITFPESVNGFTQSAVTVSGGTIASFSAASAAVYNLTVTPSGNGAVSVSVPGGAATDAAGNPSLISNTQTVTFDNTAPTVTISSSTSASTNVTPIPFTVTFSESVTGFTLSDISVSGGTAGSFSGSGSSYTFSVTPSGNGTVSVSIPAGVAQDTSGNQNTASDTLTRTFDNIAPTIALSTDAPNPTNTSPIPVVVTVSEALTGFTADDITVTGGTVADFKNVSDTKYTFNVIATGDGDVSVSVAAGKATDAAGNQNTVSNTLTRTFNGGNIAVAANPLTTNDTTPALSGTVSDPAAAVRVTVNGQQVAATVSGTN